MSVFAHFPPKLISHKNKYCASRMQCRLSSQISAVGLQSTNTSHDLVFHISPIFQWQCQTAMSSCWQTIKADAMFARASSAAFLGETVLIKPVILQSSLTWASLRATYVYPNVLAGNCHSSWIPCMFIDCVSETVRPLTPVGWTDINCNLGSSHILYSTAQNV